MSEFVDEKLEFENGGNTETPRPIEQEFLFGKKSRQRCTETTSKRDLVVVEARTRWMVTYLREEEGKVNNVM